MNTDPESLEKKNILGKIVNKVTTINGKCADFIAKHPFAVTGTILAAGVAASTISGAVGYNVGHDRGYDDGRDSHEFDFDDSVF